METEMELESTITSNSIVTTEKLDEKVLNSLFNNDICILHIPHYCYPSLCQALADWLINNDKIEPK